MTSFANWIAAQADRQDPVGHLALDLASDTTWPRDDGDLLDHLYRAGACPDAISAGCRALDEYAKAGGAVMDPTLRNRLAELDVRVVPSRFGSGQHDIAIVIDGGYSSTFQHDDLNEIVAYWRDIAARAFPPERLAAREGV